MYSNERIAVSVRLAESGENTNVVRDQDDILPGTFEATAQFNYIIRVVYVNVICMLLCYIITRT